MKNSNILRKEVLKEINLESSAINEKDLSVIVSEEKKIRDKSSKLDISKFKKLMRQVRLALELIKDFRQRRYTEIPWRTIALIAASILYFLNPLDLVPDILPLLGIADDAILFASVFKSIQVDLEKYCDWKGLNKEQYF